MAYWCPVGTPLRSNFMTNFPGYRAELANQVIFRLKRLSGEQWQRAVAILEERRRYFDLAYQREVVRLGRRVLVIDDGADRDGYDADLLLNQNVDA